MYIKSAKDNGAQFTTTETAHDELRQNEEESKNNQAFFEHPQQFFTGIFNSLASHVAVIDSSGKIVAVNKSWNSFAKSNGIEPEYVSEGINYLDICEKATGNGKSDVLMFAEAVRKILSGDETFFEMEYDCHSPEEKRWFLAKVTPYQIGLSSFAIIAHLNITDRKLVEIALQESEMLKTSIIENSPDCIKLLDLKGNLLFMSKGGLERLEIDDITPYLNKSWVGFWQKDDNTEARVAVENARSGSQGQFSGYCPTETGKPRWWDVIVSPICNKKGEVTKLLAVSRDITEQVKNENKKKQAQKLESIGFLAGGIAHDFNNILSCVIGYAELSFDQTEKGSTLHEYLQEIHSAGKRAKDLIQQILLFSRQSETDLEPIQPDIIVKEVLKFLRSTIPTTIDIQQHIESSSMIMANAIQIHQVIMNLCINASHAMEKSGGILRISLKDRADQIELMVTDSGSGIAPEVINSIFEPYFTTKDKEGTGMGLTLAKQIVEACGGKISVESKLGKGTNFTICLPVTQNKTDENVDELCDLPTGKEHILLVDDEVNITKIYERVLSQLGYTVTATTNSTEALKLFRINPGKFDLVISDMTMPNITGEQLYLEMQKIREGIPYILTTGYSKKISEEIAKGLGISALLTKPLLREDFAHAVRTTLEKN